MKAKILISLFVALSFSFVACAEIQEIDDKNAEHQENKNEDAVKDGSAQPEGSDDNDTNEQNPYSDNQKTEEIEAYHGYGKHLRLKETIIDEVPKIDAENLLAWAEGEQAFSIESLKQAAALQGSEKNLVLSPYGLHVAFSLIQAGAGRDTFQELADVLRNQAGDRTETAQRNGEIYRFMRALGNHPESELLLANRVWLSENLELIESYAQILSEDFQAPVIQVNYTQHAAEIVDLINRWATENTRGILQKIVSDKTISADTLLTLASAVYFKGEWAQMFFEVDTHKSHFKGLHGDVEIDMMKSSNMYHPYHKGDHYTAVSMDYVDNRFSFLIVMPNADVDFVAYREKFTAHDYREIRSQLKTAGLEISVPRFDISHRVEAAALAKKLGMHKIFNEGMINMVNGKLVVENAVQDAVIRVNESGTEAAAVTVIVIGPTSAPSLEVVTIDRPFLYFLVAKESGAILFAGQKVE